MDESVLRGGAPQFDTVRFARPVGVAFQGRPQAVRPECAEGDGERPEDGGEQEDATGMIHGGGGFFGKVVREERPVKTAAFRNSLSLSAP